jgi:hypothetical protein
MIKLTLLVKILLLSTIFFSCLVLCNEQQIEQQENHQQVFSNALSRRVDSQELQNLPVARLRRFLVDRGAECNGCVDKYDLIERATEVMYWPSRDDAIATDLSLEQDLMGPLHPGGAESVLSLNTLTAIPVGEDKSIFQDQANNEPIGQSPSARASLQPLTDAEVVQLLDLYHMRLLIQEGIARCGPKFLNGTQYCSPTHAVLSKESM